MTEDWREWRVVDVPMPTRARTALLRYWQDSDNVESMTLGDVAALSKREVLAMRGVSSATYAIMVALVRDCIAGKMVKEAETLEQIAKEAP